jgi:hypothetical protein
MMVDCAARRQPHVPCGHGQMGRKSRKSVVSGLRDQHLNKASVRDVKDHSAEGLLLL